MSEEQKAPRSNPLFLFCDIDAGSHRPFMHTPCLIEGILGTVATNGRILVVDERSIPDIAKYLLPAIVSIKDSYLNLTKTVVTPSKPILDGKCGKCNGRGKVSEKHFCCDCEGEGEFEHGNHLYSCKNCDGSGELGVGPAILTCSECGGSGQHSDVFIKLGEHLIKSKDYRKIMSLTDVVFYEGDFCNGNSILFFSHSNGWGAVMPTVNA